ncbi:MAG: hypothetical protein HKN74_03295 [Acidimicrobiia bacterium]|nr:hypothetical protein [Acidimicrobiia bacterium]NNL69027.1 hypothetical protein [Acidimicrobiia bacterium]
MIGRCLSAALTDAIFPEWEFAALMGASRDDLRTVVEAWPEAVDQPTDDQRSLVNNVLNNLLGYPHGLDGQGFVDRVSATEEQVAKALAAWRDDTGLARPSDYFDNLT